MRYDSDNEENEREIRYFKTDLDKVTEHTLENINDNEKIIHNYNISFRYMRNNKKHTNCINCYSIMMTLFLFKICFLISNSY